MITVRYMGQLGNQMFQYCLGKILAEKTRQMYVPDQWRNKAGNPLKWNMTPYLRPVATQGQRDGIGPLVIDCQHWFDIGNVFPGWSIEATGFFQRYERLAPYKDKIRNDWLPIKTDAVVKTDDYAVYIHVRRTDYLGDHLSPEQNCQATTMEEYGACLTHFPKAKRLIIVTDDYDDPFLTNFRCLGLPVEWVRKTWDADWLTLASCKNLIMSQSTYSWWAAFLGQATKIACPVFPNTFWGKGYRMMGRPQNGRDFPNLEVTDDAPKEWIWVTE